MQNSEMCDCDTGAPRLSDGYTPQPAAAAAAAAPSGHDHNSTGGCCGLLPFLARGGNGRAVRRLRVRDNIVRRQKPGPELNEQQIIILTSRVAPTNFTAITSVSEI